MKTILNKNTDNSTSLITNSMSNPMLQRLWYTSLCLLLVLMAITSSVQAAETVRVGYFDKKPVAFRGDDGHPRGLAVDILDDIAREKGWTLTYVHGSFPESFNRLKSEEIDLMIPIGYTASREGVIDYSDKPLLLSWGCLFTQHGGPIKSLKDVTGKRIAYVKKTLFYEPFRKITDGLGLTFDFVEVADYNEMLTGVAEGSFDGGVGDRLAIMGFDPELARRIEGSIVFHPFTLHAATVEGDPKGLLPAINLYLIHGKATPDSPYFKHLNYWLSGISEKPSALPQALAIVFGLMILGSLIYLLSRIPDIRRTLGLTEIVEVRVSTNILIVSWTIGVLLWLGNTFVEYLWVNTANKSFLSIFLAFDDVHEIMMRLLFIGAVILGGVVVSRVFARLSAAQNQTEQYAINLHTTLNSIGDAVIATDTEGTITRMNPVAANLTGWTLEEARGKPLVQVFHIVNALTNERVLNPVARVLENGEIVGLANHTILIARDGAEYQIADSAAPIRDDDGKATGVVLVFRDVTEKYRTQKALQESEEKYRLLIENQNDMLVKFDPEGRLQFVSQSYCDTFGKTQKELLGKKFMPLIHEDDREVVAEAITCVFKPPYSAKVEERAMTKEGWRWQEWNNTAILNKNNEVEAVVAVGRDIDERKQAETALKKSEKRFKDLFNSINDLIFTQDLKGRFISFNTAMQKAFGYEHEELIGHKASDFMKPELRPLFNSEYLGVLKTQGSYEGISSYLTKNGEKIYIEYRSSMVHPDGGDPYISGTGRDVTEKVLSERKVTKLQEQLTKAQKMESIGTLAGGIAHDFNNILFPVFGYLEMMLMDISEDSPLRGQLEEIFSGAKRARDLVQQILAFSRQSGHEMKPLKVHLVIKEAMKLIKSSLPSTIEISQNIKTDCGLVMADSTQFHQVIMNLCTNAFHAMEKTGGKLIVNLKESELAIEDLKDPAMIPGKYVCLTVADTGTGMEQSIIDRIFDPYYTTKEEGKGTGLGLAVAHGIVKSHGGHISVYSEPGKGTEFQILLPVIKKQKETAKVETDAPIQKGDERILLVDDEDVIVQMIGQMLERLGYHVTARTSSTDALEAFRAKPDTIDLVITDLTMPNMTGDKLAGELIKIRPDIPVILCTGFSEIMSREKADSLGIKGFLMKPVVMKDLSYMIRKVLDKEIVD